MKRANVDGTPGYATPTIDCLLHSMTPSGLDSFEDRLGTYSVLGFWFDGGDYSNKSTRAVTNLIKRMDALVPSPLPITQLEDEDNDRYGFTFGGAEYWFTSPSIQKLPKSNRENLPKYYRELIQLADQPEAVLELPYYLFGAIGDTLGKCLGIV